MNRDSPKKPLRRKVLLTIANLVLLMIVAALSYVAYERFEGLRYLRAVCSQLTTEKILRPLSELDPDPSAEALENGESLALVLEGLGPLSQQHPALLNGPKIMRYVQPGIAVPSWSNTTPIFDKSESSPPLSWDELRSQLQPARDILDRARPLLRGPVALEYDYTSLKGTDTIGPLQKQTALLRTSAIMLLHDGDTSAAVEAIVDIDRISRLVGNRGSLVRIVVSFGLWSFGASDLIWEILRHENLSNSDLAKLATLLTGNNFVTQSVRAMQIELAIVPFLHNQVVNARSPEFTWAFTDIPDGPLGSEFALQIRNTLWPIVWSDGDLARITNFWGESIKRSQALQISRNWTHFEPSLAALGTSGSNYDIWRFPFAATFSQSAAVRGILRSAVRLETKRQILRTAVALEQFRRQNGTVPLSLEELIPGQLDSLPTDWYNGQPLQYHRLSDDKFRLYSVGENATDDGGDATPVSENEPGLMSGRDIVWPQ